MSILIKNMPERENTKYREMDTFEVKEERMRSGTDRYTGGESTVT